MHRNKTNDGKDPFQETYLLLQGHTQGIRNGLMNFDRERQPQTMVYSDSMPTEIFLKTDNDQSSKKLFNDFTVPKLSNHGSPQRSTHNNRYQDNSDSGSHDHLNTNEKQGRFCTNSNILLR